MTIRAKVSGLIRSLDELTPEQAVLVETARRLAAVLDDPSAASYALAGTSRELRAVLAELRRRRVGVASSTGTSTPSCIGCCTRGRHDVAGPANAARGSAVGDADEPFERPDGRFRGAMAALVDERGDDGAHIARALRLVLAHLRDCSPGDSDGLDAIRARLAEKRLEALSGDGAEILNPATRGTARQALPHPNARMSPTYCPTCRWNSALSYAKRWTRFAAPQSSSTGPRQWLFAQAKPTGDEVSGAQTRLRFGMTTGAAAGLLGVSRRRVQQLAAARLGVKVDGRWVLDRAAVAAYRRSA
jgi:hypothetical protein